MPLVLHPLTPDRWPDLEALFAAKGCSVARGCWCMYYRRSGNGPALAPGESRTVRNREDLRAMAALDPPPGLIGYQDGAPVGWVALGPREAFARLQKSPLMKAIDELPVWSIVCFVVPSEHRRRGVTRSLLAGAIDFARRRGVRLLEAYPVDKQVAPAAESLWFGTMSLYAEAGFEEVARRKPARPVVRLALARA